MGEVEGHFVTSQEPGKKSSEGFLLNLCPTNYAETQFDLSGSIILIVICGYPLPPLKFTILLKHFNFVFY